MYYTEAVCNFVLSLMNVQIVMFFLLLFAGFNTHADSPSDYRLGSGDRIQIQVFDEDDLSMEVRLSESGTLSYPFLGQLRVAGNTVSELEAQIVRGLKVITWLTRR